jgi:hypothetical protein
MLEKKLSLFDIGIIDMLHKVDAAFCGAPIQLLGYL